MRNYFDFEETEQYGLRKGIVFYFDDLIDEEIVTFLEGVIEKFLLMTHAEFTKKRGGNDYPNRRNIRGGWRKIFHREFDNKDFTSAQVLALDNCSPQHLQTIYVLILLSNYRNFDIDSVCSFLYFQCPLDTEWSDIYQFMEDVNHKLNVCYASAGYEMAINVLHYPGSMGYGIRALRDLDYVNSEETEWINHRVRSKTGVPCPNFIQILCPDWVKKIDDKVPNDIGAKLENGKLFLDILNRNSGRMCEPTFEEIESRYQKLYHLLKPILVFPERTRFMKKDDWEKRRKRFEER